ncbi:hypothetical protein [Desulfovibrio sp. UCD-KL4C]|nr:hypothetical protein [Desulfovibrio sp. UCD-KL4C]
MNHKIHPAGPDSAYSCPDCPISSAYSATGSQLKFRTGLDLIRLPKSK